MGMYFSGLCKFFANCWEYIFQAYVSFLQTVGNTNVILGKQAASDSFVDSCDCNSCYY